MTIFTRIRALASDIVSLGRGFTLLCASIFFMNLVNVTPLISVYLGHLGISLTGLGAVLALMGYASIASRVLFGWLSDVVGYRLLISLGYAVASIAYLLFAVFSSLPWLFIPTLLLGIAPSLSEPALRAYIANAVPKDRRATAFGAFWTVVSAGIAAGMLLAGGIAYTMGFRAAFYAASITRAVTSVTILTALRDHRAAADRARGASAKRRPSMRELVKPLLNTTLLLFFAISCVSSFATGLIAQLKYLYANKVVGATAFEIGLMAFAAQLCVMATLTPAGRIADKYGRLLPITLREYGYAISTLAFLYAFNVPLLIAVNSIMAVFDALAMPARPALVADLTPRQERGTFMALYMSLRQGLSSLGVFIGFYLWQTYGLKTPFYVRALLFALSGTLYLLLRRSIRRASTQQLG